MRYEQECQIHPSVFSIPSAIHDPVADAVRGSVLHLWSLQMVQARVQAQVRRSIYLTADCSARASRLSLLTP